MAAIIFTGLLILACSVYVRANSTTRPNIVFIVADDLGWDDVSFHGSDEVLTPNIDLLAYTGVALGRHYTHCVCTPSRAALLTGKFAHTTGMQGYPLTNGEDRGIPLSEKLLPEYMKELGYETHLVGKWHVGSSRTAYLPTSRGFDSHFGYRGGVVDYYEYMNEEQWSIGSVAGFDLYRNLTPAWDVEGYLTDVFTNEAKKLIENRDQTKPLFLMLSHLAPHGANPGAILQAPQETIRSMRHVRDPERRIFAAMMKKLDDSVGEIMNTLAENKILDNTIIVFISDNGGMPTGRASNFASNWPIRGSKFTPFEGGVRATALLWTTALTSVNHLWEGYMHIADWLPTLLGAMGVDSPSELDGLNLWNNIISNQTSQRDTFFEIYTYDEANTFNSITSGDYKLIVGNVKQEYSTYLGDDKRGIVNGPLYVDAIKNSKMYSLLQEMGKSFKIEDTSLRNDIKINCNQTRNETNLCYLNNHGLCLYNIKEDPCETSDLSKVHPEVAERLKARLEIERGRIVQRTGTIPVFRDPRALPSLHNYTWTTWANDIESKCCSSC